MKYVLPLVFIVMLYVVIKRAYETTPPPTVDTKALVAKAKALQAAFDSGEVESLIASVHPAIFNIVSREEFERVARQSAESIADEVTTISQVWGEPSAIYSSGQDEVCFLPRESVLEMSGRRVNSKGFWIAARKKGTNEWLFLDGTGLRRNPELLWKLFPNLPKDIEVPPNKVELV
ncbi:hypothetical protein [Roseimicrobium sp. ORNL1]|uniref:hypothetical protein n=1 Tax=Roseimicrobium sp. ORNL1 TaxID=2711231 RepID=UPI0013E1345B|nr:hypothetical protein [Roseimicrobium sp. ORNL1]QIF04514.1 hypothetical protein G5S37_24290 [Roseimicrobium sp. ORNL1]